MSWLSDHLYPPAGPSVVPSPEMMQLLDQVEQLTALVQEIHAREAAKPEIDPKARYHLKEAADYLGISPSTLKRRVARHKFVTLYDGKTPFVMGAEILRYAREGASRTARPKPARQPAKSAAHGQHASQ